MLVRVVSTVATIVVANVILDQMYKRGYIKTHYTVFIW